MDNQNQKAMDLGLYYLTFKARTKSEVLKYFIKKKIPQKSIDYAMEKYQDYGYINDAVYLKNYIENNRRLTLYGKKRIAYDLQKRGISEILLLTIEDLYSEEDEYACCEIVAKKNLEKLVGQGYQQKRKKLFDKLSRMGYMPSMIGSVMGSLDLSEPIIELSEEEIEKKERKLEMKFNRDFEKAMRLQKNNGYTDRDLFFRVKRNLIGRGYSYEMIDQKLDNLKE
jgi:regulatory protein